VDLRERLFEIAGSTKDRITGFCEICDKEPHFIKGESISRLFH
jgi:hypothetical protein